MQSVSLFRSVAVAYSGTGVVFLVHLAGTAVVARILTPEEFGIFAVAAAIVAVAEVIRVFGTNQYIVQVKELAAPLVRGVLGFTVTMSWALALVLVAAAPIVAQIYGGAGLKEVLQILALRFVMAPFSGMTLSLLTRQMAFGRLAGIKIFCAFVGFVSVISLALLDYSYYALAWSAVITEISLFCICILFRPINMSYLPAIRGWKPIISFGIWVNCANLCFVLSTKSPELLLGRLNGFSAAAIYDKATVLPRSLAVYVYPSLTQVLFPIFAHDRHRGADQKASYFHKTMMTSVLLWPLLLFFAVSAESIILILYGDQWTAAVPVASILCLVVMIDGPFSIGRSFLIAAGQVRAYFLINLCEMLLRVCLIIVFAPLGLLAVAASQALPSLLIFVLTHRLVLANVEASWIDFLRALQPSVLVAGFAAFGAVLPMWLFDDLAAERLVLPILLNAGSIGLFWFLGVLITGHEIKATLQFRLGALARKISRSD